MDRPDAFGRLLERFSLAPESGYRYPDAGTEIEGKLPPAKREAERRLWGEAIDLALPADRRPGPALDAGCGDGDYLPPLCERFERVLGVEPDLSRAARARARCPGAAVFPVSLGDALFADPALGGAFAFVQAMQVLGHVPAGIAPELVRRLAALLPPGGALLLALPYTNLPFDDFRFSERGVAESRRVAAAEYDDAAARPRPGVLPVRHFAMPTLARLLGGAGLVQEWCAPYGWLSCEHADLLVLARKR